jgi:hypothetical protein
MKNKILILSILFLTVYQKSFTQEIANDSIALLYLQKAEINILGVGVNYEIPISKVFSLDSGVGFSGGAQIINNKINFQKNFFEPSLYFKSELKYYYNRYIRVAKKLPTRNGEGSYFGFQNKFLSQFI